LLYVYACIERKRENSQPSLYFFAENVAIDLETFCNHAGRTTVTTDDVLLLARKNPDLHGIMKAYVDGLKADKEAATSRVGGAKKSKAKK
jgi:centromere protein S